MTNEETKEKTMEENYKDLQALIECLNIDFDKFREKNVKAAGQRARNNLLNTKKVCDKLRKQILAQIKTIPVKHRISDDEDIKSEDSKSDEVIEIVDTEVIETGANGPVEEEKKEDEPKKPRKRKANKKKETEEN